jgi:hypothetical protein
VRPLCRAAEAALIISLVFTKGRNQVLMAVEIRVNLAERFFLA